MKTDKTSRRQPGVSMAKRAGVHHKGAFSLLEMINNVKNEPNFKKAGAITLFIGVVRGEAEKGEKVQKLELEAYEEKANQVLTKICNELRKRPGVTDVQIHHMLGEFSVGEDMVYVLVAGSTAKTSFLSWKRLWKDTRAKCPSSRRNTWSLKRAGKRPTGCQKRRITD